MQSDVITCAAPNYYPIKKYNKFEYKDVVLAMFSRIDHILYSAWKEKADILLKRIGVSISVLTSICLIQHLKEEKKYIERYNQFQYRHHDWQTKEKVLWMPHKRNILQCPKGIISHLPQGKYFINCAIIIVPFLITPKHLLPNVRKVFFAESIIQLVL